MTAPATGGATEGAAAVPPGEREVLTELVLRTFRLNGMFLQVAEQLARPAGLTAAWWQVLGAVLREPLTVAGVARDMGLARQSVQRVADLLVANGLAELRPNPAHARAKLLAPTDAGRAAIGRLSEGTVAWARAVTDVVGEDDLRRTVEVMDRLVAVLPEVRPDGAPPSRRAPRPRGEA